MSAEGGVTDLTGWIQVDKVGEATVCLRYWDSTVSFWYIHYDSMKIHLPCLSLGNVVLQHHFR